MPFVNNANADDWQQKPANMSEIKHSNIYELNANNTQKKKSA